MNQILEDDGIKVQSKMYKIEMFTNNLYKSD